MPFIPHTEEDIRAMCAAIGVADVEQLFDEIPQTLKSDGLAGIPAGMSEMQVTRLMHERARLDRTLLNFIGAGAYEHHIPAAVWQVATRGEFYSAYTPYQAEASQGTLQLLYEYQSMLASLTGLDVTNASLYDGATALAEAVLMAVRLHKSARRVLIPAGVNPAYRRVVASIVSNQRIELIEVPYSAADGRVTIEALESAGQLDFAALVVAQPNFFGVLETVNALTDWAHSRGALTIACVNPTALALLKSPGEWGGHGADIAVGEGQPLGVPLANGGPYFGFMACKQALVRQMPGRIVGATVDVDGKRGYTLTLQAREQHIRRSKATSNICTNQGLAVTAATIYLAMLGAQGLKNVAAQSHANTLALLQRVTRIRGVRQAFSAPVFHEAVIRLPRPVAKVLADMRSRGILGGHDVSRDYPELGAALLVCATETKTESDLDAYAAALATAAKA
ncbi:MAG TPA: aminomethyl-transferring glycine dehydrogenase subunit GcvPA [Burkholderiales bacterium]|jgi:glycine dehydrogenase subunit 1|nr:aminomethyl-transferring glycine dehydrogenase subunit GcvPA [Burkholderiales bacterium]